MYCISPTEVCTVLSPKCTYVYSHERVDIQSSDIFPQSLDDPRIVPCSKVYWCHPRCVHTYITKQDYTSAHHRKCWERGSVSANCRKFLKIS